MANFLMLGKYSSQGVQGLNDQTTALIQDQVVRFGGKVLHMYAVLGKIDFVIIASFPGAEEAIKAGLGIGKETGITFNTQPAFTIDEFDDMLGDL